LDEGGPRIDRKPIDGECLSEPKKPLLPIVPGVDGTVGDEVMVSTLLGAPGMSNDNVGWDCGISSGSAVVKGDVNAGDDGSDRGDGVR